MGGYVRQFQRSRPYHSKLKTLPTWKRNVYIQKNTPILNEYRSAGTRLKSIYPDGKFPLESTLDSQRQALYEEREKLNREYVSLKKEYADLDRASRTISDYLESLRDKPERKRKKGELE
ncbi:MAG: hypothetical protein K2J08_09275 [Ruminococcus sp.]|nr:hypothetical protein [Ruminococcus sp.]